CDLAGEHFLTVERPTLEKYGVFMLTTNFVTQMVRDRHLQEMPRDSFVSENRPRFLDRCPTIKVLRLRVVTWNEKETGRIFIVNAGRVHETAGAGWLECIRQLTNLKRAEIIRQRDQ